MKHAWEIKNETLSVDELGWKVKKGVDIDQILPGENEINGHEDELNQSQMESGVKQIGDF